MKTIFSCRHNPITSELGMLEWYAEVDRRAKKRMVQKQCPVCKLWFYKDEFKAKK